MSYRDYLGLCWLYYAQWSAYDRTTHDEAFPDFGSWLFSGLSPAAREALSVGCEADTVSDGESEKTLVTPTIVDPTERE